ncbi:hypothetical protein [Haladaptatus sp. NG-SE-30]
MDIFAAGNGAVLRFALYLLLFWPTVGYYVYRDSTRRGKSQPLARGLAIGAFGIAGLAVYLFRRDYSSR